jgi:excisionase family DNA binding protein
MKSAWATAAEEPLVSMAAVAEYLGVPLQTLRKWRKYGRGPTGYPMGRAVKFRLSEVEEWLQRQREARSEAGDVHEHAS